MRGLISVAASICIVVHALFLRMTCAWKKCPSGAPQPPNPAPGMADPTTRVHECAHMLRLRLGIAEIDSYNMLFYGHYLRYNERAANSCLSLESTCATIRGVALAKYISSVRWNDIVDIRTTAVPSEGTGEHSLLHEWFVNEKYDKPVYLCLCSYAIEGPAGFTGAHTPDVKEARRLTALQREAANVFTPQDAGLSQNFAVYPDMVGPGGALAVPCVMDLFERQRTVLIGGQEELERLKLEGGTFIVVYLIQMLTLQPATVVRPREEIEVSTAYTVQGDGLFYCVKQSVAHRPSGQLCAEGWLKLAFVRDGVIGKAPPAILSRLGISDPSK